MTLVYELGAYNGDERLKSLAERRGGCGDVIGRLLLGCCGTRSFSYGTQCRDQILGCDCDGYYLCKHIIAFLKLLA